MTYKIIIQKKAKKFIDKLPMNEKRRIVGAIERLPNGELFLYLTRTGTHSDLF